MVDTGFEGNDRWNIPDDRQLALRGRLDTGWSSYRGSVYTNTKSRTLTDSEFMLIATVLQKRDLQQIQEQERIGLLVKKLELMRKNVLGDGQTTCLICGAKARFKDSLRICLKCDKMVCSKCSIESKSAFDHTKSYFCVLCYEERQLWKRSGAWFYNSMPTYKIPDIDNNDMRKSTIKSHSSARQHPNVLRDGSVRRNSRDNTLQESFDDLSDESDIEETATEKAFVVSSELSSKWQGQIDVNDNSHHRPRETLLQKSLAGKTLSSEDEYDRTISPKNSNTDNKYQSQNSLSPESLNKNGGSLYESQASHGSTSSLEIKFDKKSALGVKGLIRKISKTGSYTSSEADSISLNHNGNSSQRDNDNVSETSSNSTQELDDMFKSYGSEQMRKMQEESETDKDSDSQFSKQEYHGKQGMVEFTLQYDLNTQELLVIIDNCKGLKGPGKGNKPPFSYVKTYLLPEEAKASKKRTTKQAKKSFDPVYNETLVYHGISEDDILTKGLRLSVMDENKIGNNPVIGETLIPLKNLASRPVQQFRRILDAKSNVESLYLDSKTTPSNPGRIEIALHYLSKHEKLVVGIIRCVGLKALDPNGFSDPYVKCYLLPDPQKKTKQKTSVKKKTLNPDFNQEFTYKIPVNELATKTLHVSVWDHDVGRSNDFIGGITLGIDSAGDALKHWFDTLKTADRRVVKWHTLREDCQIIE